MSLKFKDMPIEILTNDDLRKFKTELFHELKEILKEHYGQPMKKWLKSYEVRELLGISPGKLQKLRSNGTLPYTKIGGMMFYDYENIKKMLDENLIQSQFTSTS